MGCLTAPFKLAGLLLFVLALVAAWLYRDRLADIGRAAWNEATGTEETVAGPGVPSADALARADRKVASLRAGADSVVLSAAEAASLLQRGLEPYARTFFDSMEVTLREGSVGVTTIVRTDRLPSGLLGPFGGALREREPVSAEGPLTVSAAGRGSWEIRRLQFRDIPLPRDAVPRLIGRATGDTARSAVPIALPDGVSGLRVRDGGLTLYRHAP
ncbi:MAG TPA: hypothetical protein VF037_11080 [Gemmatimonadales bacterium]